MKTTITRFAALAALCLLALPAGAAPVPISGLPTAETLAGTEKVPVVQDGQTRAATIDQIKAYSATTLVATDISDSTTVGRNVLKATDAAAARAAIGSTYGTTAGTAAAGDDSRITGAAQKANNLSDLASTATAWTNLGGGTLGQQSAAAVAITGGTVNGTSVGATTPSSGAFTSLSATGNTTLGDASADTVVMNAKSITKPNMPAFMAEVGSNVLDQTGDATAYTVIANTERVDRGNDYNSTTGVFTAPITGIYQFQGCVQLGGVLSGHTDFAMDITVSGTSARVYFDNFGDLQPDSAGRAALCMTILAPMTANDTAFLQVQVSGSTKVVDILAGTNSTTFSGWLVG